MRVIANKLFICPVNKFTQPNKLMTSHLFPLLLVLFDTFSWVDLEIVLADWQEFLVVKVQVNHLIIIPQFQFLRVLILKILRTDLLADDLCPDVIFGLETEPHLFQEKFYLFFLFHWSKCFDLKNRNLHIFGIHLLFIIIYYVV